MEGLAITRQRSSLQQQSRSPTTVPASRRPRRLTPDLWRTVSDVATVVVMLSIAAATPGATGYVTERVYSGAMVITAGAALELASAFSGTVAFAGATGTLKIDNSSSLSGTISEQLAIGNVIDLAEIAAGGNARSPTRATTHPALLRIWGPKLSGPCANYWLAPVARDANFGEE
jgi:hypothetical protein